MTRDQIKARVLDILITDSVDAGRSYNPYHILEPTAEKIMKLWDKGFTYDLPKNDSSWDRGVQGQVDADHVWRDEWGNAR